MPKTRRMYLPGVGFHITARTQNGAKFFVPEMREEIFNDIEEAVSSFGHTLLAQAVMPNHLHIVLKHGSTPLGWMMQRILQRTVMRVRRATRAEGHVFGRPYWSGVCGDPGYLRRAVVYTHLNPVKAGLCSKPEEYAWTTHNKFVQIASEPAKARCPALPGLTLFAHRSLDLQDMVESYLRFVRFCEERRKSGIPGDWLLPLGANRLLIPQAEHGDSHWATSYSAFAEVQQFTRPETDVTKLAIAALKRIDKDLTLEMLRLVGRSKRAAGVRNQVIADLVAAGCKKVAIARSLRVSPALVSRVATAMRFAVAAQ